MLKWYRNWKLRHVRKRLEKNFNFRSLADMRSLLKIVHDIPLRVLCTMTPEHRGFASVFTVTENLMQLRKAANASLLEITNYDNLETLFRDYVKSARTKRTLSTYLSDTALRLDVLCAKVDDVTRTLELICKTISASPDAGYLSRVHEPMFEDYVTLIKGMVNPEV